MSELMERLKQAVLDGDEDEALAAAEEAIAEGMEPLAVVEQSIQPAMDESGMVVLPGRGTGRISNLYLLLPQM